MDIKQFRPATALLIAISLAAGFLSPAMADIRYGAQSDEPAPIADGTPQTLEPAGGLEVIDFDDAAAPCTHTLAVALRDEYAALGVHFSSSAGPNDGGAILDECSNYGVTGFSAPNFLAFNSNNTMSDGGVPRTPEVITFDHAVTDFQINAGVGGVSGAVTIEARNSQDAVVGTDSINLASGMQTLSVSGNDICAVIVTSTAFAFALDDMAFTAQPVPTLPATGFILLAIVLVGLSLWMAKRSGRRSESV